MATLHIDLTNCFGIGHLTHDIIYDENDRTEILYAPNGTMKTSLTKTIKKILEGKQPSDEMYPNRVSSSTISIDGTPINNNNVYVFNNNDKDGTDYISTFLANSTLKRRYDAIYVSLEDAKKALKRKVKEFAPRFDCEKEILLAFRQNSDETYFDCLNRIKDEIDNHSAVLTDYDFKYNDLFDTGNKVKQFVDDNIHDLQRYFNKYQELVGNSCLFNAGENSFGTTQATALLKSVNDNRFFGASHKFVLRNGKEIESKEDMQTVINNEMERILSDQELKNFFQIIDKKLQSNTELRDFKDVIERYPDLVPELLDYDSLRKKILRGYMVKCEDTFTDMVHLYNANIADLTDIINEAKNQRSQWEKVIDMFNTRFFVPFRLELKNKANILLSDNTAELVFLYQDADESLEEKERKTLLEHLSCGEQKAFFILQNIFEIEARKTIGQQTLLVFDDVADSFDYKNKYAIIEYLSDIADDPNFNLLILTHNFDFYRTVVSRLKVGKNIFFAQRDSDRKIELKTGIYKPDILRNKLLNRLSRKREFISCIPFIRNIIEYTKNCSDSGYMKLTSCLHQMPDTATIKMKEIYSVFCETIKSAECVEKDEPISFFDEYYLESLYREADTIIGEELNEVNLVNKLILSMAIRLKAENYMAVILTDEQKTEMAKNRNQTGEFVKVFKKYHMNDMEDKYRLMNRVLMLTSENIHFNNFMFEPIVDTSNLCLRQLYEEVQHI